MHENNFKFIKIKKGNHLETYIINFVNNYR